MSRDPIYTPEFIGRQMLDCVGISRVRVVVDFAVGDGGLLRLAERKWPKAEILGLDIDREVVARLRRHRPRWHLGVGDFLSETSHSRSRLIANARESRPSVILLNPPFSFRGGTSWNLEFRGRSIRCSRAMAFLLRACNFLSEKAELVAVVPASVSSSQRDTQAWSMLRETMDVEIVARHGRAAFVPSVPSTFILRVKYKKVPVFVEDNGHFVAERVLNGTFLRIVRGVTQMHRLDASAGASPSPVVHTSELQRGQVQRSIRTARVLGRSVTGPAVLLPRVCKPRIDKVALYTSPARIVLSDCVIGIVCRSSESARSVQRALVANWSLLEGEYGGTCARYLTIQSLRRLLEALGADVSVENKRRSI